jgi:hypothetical protein
MSSGFLSSFCLSPYGAAAAAAAAASSWTWAWMLVYLVLNGDWIENLTAICSPFVSESESESESENKNENENANEIDDEDESGNGTGNATSTRCACWNDHGETAYGCDDFAAARWTGILMTTSCAHVVSKWKGALAR